MIKNNNNLKIWLEKKLPRLGNLNKIEKFDVGQSNPTYLLHCDNKKIVLRSKPMGNLLRGAHRIDREYRVMSALRETKIPVPNMIIYCDENKIIGSEFFLMDFIDGIKEKKPILENYSKDEIYDHRKTKFLKIGRGGGFAKPYASREDGLEYKEPISLKLKRIFSQNKYILSATGLVIIASIFALLY